MSEMQIKTTRGITSHWSEWTSSKHLQTTMLERVWRKGSLLGLLIGMQVDTATMEKSVEIPLKTGN